MTTSTLAYSTWTGKEPEPITEEPCLGSQGVISTTQCNRIAEMTTGKECPLCVL